MKIYRPLDSNHPLVVEKTCCFLCEKAFQAGDRTSLVPKIPTDDLPPNEIVEAVPAHAECMIIAIKIIARHIVMSRNLKIGESVIFHPKVFKPPYAPHYDKYLGHRFRVLALHPMRHVELICIDDPSISLDGHVHDHELVSVEREGLMREEHYGIKLNRLASGEPNEYDGYWLVDYIPPSPWATDHRGILSAHLDPRKARRFGSKAEAFTYWKQQYGIRPDGKPNRPLTAWTVAIEPLDPV